MVSIKRVNSNIHYNEKNKDFYSFKKVYYLKNNHCKMVKFNMQDDIKERRYNQHERKNKVPCFVVAVVMVISPACGFNQAF